MTYFLLDPFMQSLFFELIRISVSVQKELSHRPSTKEWELLYRMAERQTVLGVCFKAVKEMADSVPQSLYLKWLAMAAKIQQRNEEMNRKCAEVYEAIRKGGFGCAVLKGQGVAELYNVNLDLNLWLYRQSGDIDVWLWKEGASLKENRKEVIRFARTIQPNATGAEHHVGVEWLGTDVELHYEPAYFCNPFANRRFRKWFMDYDKSRFQLSENGFCVPDTEFNRVFLLAHAFRHYMSEGLGLRQVMDYYFLTKNLNLDLNIDLNHNNLIKRLGMARFEKAMKWVIGYVFEGKDIDDGRKCGKMLLAHIMDGGNFGKHKVATVANRHTHIGRFINQLTHDIQLIKYYPCEAIWAPLSMIREFIRIRI
ncbi:MAG: nucleotidyltransferase family protein [Bacteroides sp.]